MCINTTKTEVAKRDIPVWKVFMQNSDTNQIANLFHNIHGKAFKWTSRRRWYTESDWFRLITSRRASFFSKGRGYSCFFRKKMRTATYKHV